VNLAGEAEAGDLLKTDFLLFNKGKGVVVYQDLVLNPRLQLQFSATTKFYSIDLVDVTSETINSKYEQKNNCIHLHIDYLTQNSLYHISVLSSEKHPEAIKVIGEFTEGKALTKYARPAYLIKKLQYSLPYVIAGGLVLALVANLFIQLNYAVMLAVLVVVGYIAYILLDQTARTVIDKKVKGLAA
jgi:hypothetical protein